MEDHNRGVVGYWNFRESCVEQWGCIGGERGRGRGFTYRDAFYNTFFFRCTHLSLSLSLSLPLPFLRDLHL